MRKGRFVYGYNYSPQNKSGQVIECTYPNDSVVITKNSIFDSWHQQLLSCDTTATSIYVEDNKKTINQYCKVQNCALGKESHCLYTSAFSEKVIMFNENGKNDKITYSVKSSGSRKEKSRMKVIYSSGYQ